MATTIVSRTQSGSESAAGRRTWTFSCWFKRCGISSSQELFGSDSNGARSNNYNIIDLNASDQIDFAGYESGITFRKTTTRLFRDTNAWYHLVIAFDSTQSTADDRIKIYINGTRETSFGTSTNPAQDHQSKFFSSGKVHAFGRSSQTFDGVISHCHATEGTAYAPTVFGSTDATTGEWKINTNPSVSYGTNGFFLFKNDNAVTNQAGNSSGNFAVTAGTLTKTEDCPSNVFCNFNAIGPKTDVTLANGNNNATYGTSSSRTMLYGTLGAASGKYYWECEIQGSTSANNAVLGVTTEIDYSTQVPGITNYAWGFRGYDGAVYNNNSSVGGTWATFTNGDIIGVAINLDDEQGGLNKLYFSKNGTWLNGADPSNHSSTTGVVGITRPEDGTSGFIFPVFGDAGTSATPKFKMNWGNGYFGSSTVASAGTNASNNGIFEYDVPTGFTALSTKGLNL